MNPLIITVGPQCSLKTTYLAQMGSVCDICLDNIAGIYDKVSTECIISELFDVTSVDNDSDILEKSKYSEHTEMLLLMLLFKGFYDLKDVLNIITSKYVSQAHLQYVLIEVVTNTFASGCRFVRSTNISYVQK